MLESDTLKTSFFDFDNEDCHLLTKDLLTINCIQQYFRRDTLI